MPSTAMPSDGIGDAGETCFVEMVFPEHSNHYGTLFAGNGLSLMSKAAFVAATRRARRRMVMRASDKVEFHEPVRVGEIVELTARIARVGRSSMTVIVDGVAEELVSGERRPAMRGSFEMVAVDGAGRPTAIAGSSPSEKKDTPS